MRKELSDEEILQTLKRLEKLAVLSDTKYKIPGTNIPIGLDAMIGFIPIVGEVVGLLMSFYIMSEARKIGVPFSIKLKMFFNIAVDFVIGFIPIIGDLGDIAYRSNIRNIQLILAHVEENRRLQKRLEQEEKDINYRLLLALSFIALVVIAVLLTMLL